MACRNANKVVSNQRRILPMHAFAFRIMAISLAVSLFIVPLYAHHGSQFLSRAMEMNTAEIRMAELAVDKAQNPNIKDFAQMVIRDHNQALARLRELRDNRLALSISGKTDIDQKTTKNIADVSLTPQDQQMLDRLSKLSGADFDREFMNTMIQDHREGIRVFDAQSKAHGANPGGKQPAATSGQNTTREKPEPADRKNYSMAELKRDLDTADFASATLPTMQQHLQKAEDIQKQLQTR
jgi:predicted outer membrane protein